VGNTIDTGESRTGNQSILKRLGNMDFNEIRECRVTKCIPTRNHHDRRCLLYMSIMHLGKEIKQWDLKEMKDIHNALKTETSFREVIS